MDQRKWETMLRVEHVLTGEDFLALHQKLQQDNLFYFRGQENECWNLRNALHRLKLHRKERDLPPPDELAMIRQFQRDIPGKARGKNLWDLLGTMQHYGVPTRMMDFTESFLVAAFFAITEASFSTCSGRFQSIVLAINKKIPRDNPPEIQPDALAEFSKEKEFNISYHLFVHRMTKPAARVKRQQGVFLFMHDPYIELASKLSIENNWYVMREEKAIYDFTEQWARSTGLLLIQFSLSVREFTRVREFLNRNSMKFTYLFPDAHGKTMDIGGL